MVSHRSYVGNREPGAHLIQLKLFALGIHGRGMESTIKPNEIDFLVIATPRRKSPASLGDLPAARATREMISSRPDSVEL
jgi:hypothetical protein